MAWRLGKANVSGDGSLKDQPAVKAPQVSSDGRCEISALVIHRQQQSLDLQLRVNDATQAGQRVEEFGYAFEGVVFALNRY